MLLSVLSLAMMMGIVPERDSAIREGRANLCETIAFTSSEYISHGETRRLDRLLETAVERNDDLLSAGVRRVHGGLVSVFGDHEREWPSDETHRSTDTHVRVPIRSGSDRWGVVELCFRPLKDDTWLGTLTDPWIMLSAFVCLASFVLFQLYLKKMLAHLDPSKSVPKRVRQALDTMAEGLLVLDRQYRIVLPNQPFASWIGVDADRLLGKKADELGWKLDSPQQTPWHKALTTESVVAGEMMELSLSGHPPKTLNTNASPVLGQQGKIRGVLVSFDDVTQLEETKRDLTVAKRVADDANQAKSEFLARMSHEIRTPMNGVIGMASLMSDTPLNVEQREYIDTINSSGNLLLSVINDILDFSKVEAGKLTIEQHQFDLIRCVDEAVTLVRSRAERKGLSLFVKRTPDLPRHIKSDSTRLQQVLTNLLSNAIKFTSEGNVTVSISLHSEDEEGQCTLLFEVSDTGTGIPESRLHRLFQPFSQIDDSITRRFGGTGLGLAISKRLVELMGGSIHVESEVGRGSTFIFTIVAPREREKQRITPHPVIDQPPAILLISENQVEGRLLERIFSLSGGTLIAASPEKVQEESFDVSVYPYVMIARGREELVQMVDSRHLILLVDEHETASHGKGIILQRPITREAIERILVILRLAAKQRARHHPLPK